MEERRKYNRWYLDAGEEKAVVSWAGRQENVRIIDISAGGIKMAFYEPVEIGTTIFGEFKVLPHLGPFYIRGKVKRVTENEGIWEVVVEFEKVSSLPLVS